MKLIHAAVIVLAFSGISALSQERVIDEAAFNAGMRRSQRPVAEWQGKARRIFKTSEDEFSNLPGMDHFYKDVTEYDGTGACRFLWESIIGGQGQKGEVVTIGNVSFNRNGIEKWTKREVPPSGIIQPTLPFENSHTVDRRSYSSWYEPGSSVEFKLRTGTHKNEDVLIYRRVEVLTLIHPRDGSEIQKETIDHYWISAEGRLKKFEQWINHNGKHFHGRQKVVMEWELDPDIVITAPSVLP